MKYCGVVTPLRARSAVDMPGSETALEELPCRVLGHLLEQGVIAKIADDLAEETAHTNSFRNGEECYRRYTSAISLFLRRRPSSIPSPQRYLDGSGTFESKSTSCCSHRRVPLA